MHSRNGLVSGPSAFPLLLPPCRRLVSHLVGVPHGVKYGNAPLDQALEGQLLGPRRGHVDRFGLDLCPAHGVPPLVSDHVPIDPPLISSPRLCLVQQLAQNPSTLWRGQDDRLNVHDLELAFRFRSFRSGHLPQNALSLG